MGEDVLQLVEVLRDGLAHGCEAVLDRVCPLPERQRVQGEELGLLLPRLEQHDVPLKAVVRQVALHGELEARVEQRPQHLVHHDLEPAVGQVASIGEVLRSGLVRIVGLIVEGTERVVTDDQVGALLDRHVDVRRVAHPAVHVIDAVDAGRTEEAGQRRGRLHRLGDRDLGILVRPEDHAFGSVEVARAQEELPAPLPVEGAEVVRHADLLEPAPHPAFEGLVVEDAGRNVVRERRKIALGRRVLDDPHREGLEGRVGALLCEASSGLPERLG